MLRTLRGRIPRHGLRMSFAFRPRIRPEMALHLPVNFLRPLFWCSQAREEASAATGYRYGGGS